MQLRETSIEHDDAVAAAAFARFARTRDPHAFAAAFDATAPRLLLVAERLTRGRLPADDLFQDAWLHAIRRADRFDASRPLLPWLIGILVRVAKLRRRTEARAQRRTDAQRESASETSRAPSPFDVAAGAEFDAAVADALRQIDERHRLVLVLRLVHGLSSSAIGQALGRAPDTVRMQFARGLARLRRLLPAGHALPALAVVDVAVGDRLGVVRTALLAQASAVTFVGASIVKLVIGGGLAAMLVVLAVALAWSRGGGPDAVTAPDASIADTGATLPNASASGATLPGSELGAAAASERSAVPIGPPATATATMTNVAGRCVDELGRPLANVTVTMTHVDRKGQPWPPQITGVDGRFAFAAPPDAPQRCSVTLEAVGRAHRSGSVPKDGVLGDLVVPTATPLRGRFVDDDGAAVRLAAATVVFRTPVARLDRWASDLFHGGIKVTDADAFATQPLIPGAWRVELKAVGWFATPVTLIHGDGVEVVFVCREAPPLRGVVVDDADRPIEGASVIVDANSLPMMMRRPVQTDADGTFTMANDGSIDPVHDVPICVGDGSNGRFATTTFVVRYDGTHLRLVVQRCRSLSVAVVDAATGAPIERATVGWVGEASTMFVERVAQAPKGVATLTGMPAGSVRLLVCGPDDRYAIAERVVAGVLREGDAGAPDVVVRLEEAAVVHVRVVDADGRACEGVKVECVDPIGRAVTTATAARARVASIGKLFLTPFDVVRVGLGTTGRDGVAAVLRTDPSSIGVIRLSGGGIAATVVHAPFAGMGTAADPIRVVAARPGTVQVRVADAPDETLRLLLVREAAGGIEKHPAIGTGVNVDASGVATFDGVPPGLWQLRLQRFGEAFAIDGAPHALAVVDVAAGASVAVPVDVRPLTPGWLATTVEPRDDAPLEMHALDGVRDKAVGSMLRLDPIAGHVALRALFPGRYRLVRPRDGASTTFTVLPGTPFRDPLRF